MTKYQNYGVLLFRMECRMNSDLMHAQRVHCGQLISRCSFGHTLRILYFCVWNS